MDTKDFADSCHSILSMMVAERTPCTLNHPIRKAMRDLQRRYSGVFPTELNKLWKKVKTPEQPNAPYRYHSNIERLMNWIGNEFNFKPNFEFEGDHNEPSTGSAGEGKGSNTIGWESHSSGGIEVEEGLRPSEIPDNENDSEKEPATGTDDTD